MSGETSLPARLRELIVRRVAELPDRTSPDDWPEAMLVTSAELSQIVADEVEAAQAALPTIHTCEGSAPCAECDRLAALAWWDNALADLLLLTAAMRTSESYVPGTPERVGWVNACRTWATAFEAALAGPQAPTPPVLVEVPTHNGTMPKEFEDWASQIIDEAGTKADSQVEWEIVEALQKAWKLGAALAGGAALPAVQADPPSLTDAIPRELTRELLDALESDATSAEREAAFDKLRDLVFPIYLRVAPARRLRRW